MYVATRILLFFGVVLMLSCSCGLIDSGIDSGLGVGLQGREIGNRSRHRHGHRHGRYLDHISKHFTTDAAYVFVLSLPGMGNAQRGVMSMARLANSRTCREPG